MLGPLHTLIVEDSEDDAWLVVRELKRGGFEVDHVRVDSSAAMGQALDSGKWDLVVSDYSMPGFSGAEALRLLRARNQEVPFIYVSGTLGEDAAVEALKSGAQDYLAKGKLTRLVSAVERELRDIADRRERKRLAAEVQQLQRFEAIGRLAGGIAHDFNNVIGAILGWAELGEQELPEGHKTRERFRKIQQQAEYSGNLTRQLLAFARQQVLEPRRLDLSALVKESVGLVETLIGRNVSFELTLTSNAEPVWADATQIQQVIMNLCINARDAMPDGGRISIRTDSAVLGPGGDPPPSGCKPGKYMVLSISDTGTGMDAGTLEHIFEPFFTTKEPGKGTGLGLSTVYGIVGQHGGSINVESKLGAGTTFRIYLPAAGAVAVN